MNTKKLLAGAVSAGLALSMLAGCGGNASPESNTAGSQGTDPSKPTEISVYYNYDWFDDAYASTSIGQELQKRTNTKLNFMKSPTADNQKLNMMLTSKQLPDLITLDRGDPMTTKLIESGLVYPISDLIDEYAPEMLKNSEPEYFQYYKWKDGKQYYFPSFVVTDWDVAQPDCDPVSIFFNAFRSDVYEAIGSPEIKTPDQLFDALMKAKEKFPELTPWYFGPYNPNDTFFKANGFADSLFPATQFGVKLYNEVDGKLVSGVRSEEFKNYIKFMNKCYTNDLLATESFADALDIATAKIAEGNFAMVSTGKLGAPEGAKIQANPDASWIPMPYLEGAECFKDGSGWTATFISKNCKDLEGVMRFVSYCASEEGRRLISTGIEGVHWEYREIDGKQVPRLLPEWEELRLNNWDEFVKKGGFTTPFAFEDSYIHNQAYTLSTSEKSDYYKTLDEYYKPHIKADITIGLVNPAGTSEEGIIQANLSELAISYYPKMVMASSEEEAMSIYNEFITRADEMGLEKLEKAWTDNSANFK